MPSRPYRPTATHTFGPGSTSSAIKALIWTNVAIFLATSLVPSLTIYFGLAPVAVFEEWWIWQPVTYMFLHGGVFHILFNMLALWMFGTQLERLWGTAFFYKYYFVTGVGAGITTLVVSLLPTDPGTQMYYSVTVGASGAIYGLLLAYALYYPDQPIYMYLLFPIPAKYFVLIIGGIAFLSSANSSQGGVAHIAHLGGLVWGYVYLKGGRTGILAEIKYRYLRWKMSRLREKFTVHTTDRRDHSGRRPH